MIGFAGVLLLNPSVPFAGISKKLLAVKGIDSPYFRLFAPSQSLPYLDVHWDAGAKSGRVLLGRLHQHDGDKNKPGLPDLVELVNDMPALKANVPGGEFVFLVFDNHKKSLSGIVDGFRHYSLYFTERSGNIYFATTIKLLREICPYHFSLNPSALHHYFSTGVIPAPLSIFKDVVAIPAGNRLTCTQKGINYRRYWDFSEKILDRESNKLVNSKKEVKEMLIDAVRHAVASPNGNIGLLLSSGLDSTSIAFIVSRILEKKDVCALTIGFEPFVERDEVIPAREFAQSMGIKHEFRLINSRSFWEWVPDIVRALDQPSFDGIDSYLAFKTAGDAGLKTLIAGHGGDELFGGYPTYRMPGWDREIPGELQDFCKEFAAVKFTPDNSFMIHHPKEISVPIYGAWLKSELSKDHIPVLSLLMETCNDFTHSEKIPFKLSQKLEYKWALTDRQLRDSGAVASYLDLTLRNPFLDYRLWKFAGGMSPMSLTPHAQPKGLLKDIIREFLPGSILKLSKRGFEIPLYQWLIHDAISIVENIFTNSRLVEWDILSKKNLFSFLGEIKSLPANHPQANSRAYKVWQILVMELWIRLVLEKDNKQFRWK